MKSILVLCALVAGSIAWAAESDPPSRRAQNFVVYDLRAPGAEAVTVKSDEGKRIVKLDLDALALSAERIKRALCQQLNLSFRDWGKIYLSLVSATKAEQGIVIIPTRYADGWQYQVKIPDQLEDLKLIRGIVEVLLLEFANRGAGPKSAEIPLWLNEGLSFQLANSMGPDLIVPSVNSGFMVRTTRETRGVDPLREARLVLKSASATTIEELSHPAIAELAGENLKRYQCSAQLLVKELCSFPNGRLCLVKMLRELPHCWNWETAFLRAFQGYFPQMLDLEKWWTVILIDFTGRDPTQVWPGEKCLDRLDELLLVPAQIRLNPDVLPVRTYVTLQQIVNDWDFSLQKGSLGLLENQLAILRVNCPLKVVDLIDRYRQAIQTYLQKRTDVHASSGTKRQEGVSAHLLVRQMVLRLDELYRERETLRRDYRMDAASGAKP